MKSHQEEEALFEQSKGKAEKVVSGQRGGGDDGSLMANTFEGCLSFINQIKARFSAGQFQKFLQMLVLHKQQVIFLVMLQKTFCFDFFICTCKRLCFRSFGCMCKCRFTLRRASGAPLSICILVRCSKKYPSSVCHLKFIFEPPRARRCCFLKI